MTFTPASQETFRFAAAASFRTECLPDIFPAARSAGTNGLHRSRQQGAQFLENLGEGRLREWTDPFGLPDTPV